MSSPAGSYKNYDYNALSTAEVDAIDSFLPMPASNILSQKLDAALNLGQSTRVILSAAQLRTLNATPVTIIPAPGAGKAIVLNKVIAKLNYNSVAFDAVGSGDDFTLKYTDASGAILAQTETVGFLDQSSNQVRVSYPNGGTTATVTLTPVANAPVVANILAGEIAAANANANGDSTLTLDILYSIVNV